MASTTASGVTDEHANPPSPAPQRQRETEGKKPKRPTLSHEPALDGLRGLAVVAVFAFHLGWIDGGFLGVDLFFVLSGFLITSLLLVEHRENGKIDLGRFWARRARRLFPALLLLLVGVAVLLQFFTPGADRPQFRGDALATLAYVANWHRMVDSLGYWDIFTQPSPLDHTWSLAIEEQFYVLWPLVVFGLCGLAVKRGVTTVRTVAVGGAVTSLALLAWLYSPTDTNRAYFGSDTRLGPILLGAALAAFTLHLPRRDSRPSRRAEVVGALAMAWLLWSFVTIDGLERWYYQGGLALFSVAAVVVITVTTGGPVGLLGSLLAWRPLAALGLISYGVYLWHWPVVVYLTPERVHRNVSVVTLDDWAVDLARIVVTLGVAIASYKLVELPIRHGALRGPRLWAATPVAVAGVLVATLVVTAGEDTSLDTAADIDAEPDQGIEQRAREGSDNPIHIYPSEIPAGARRVLLVGDSGVYFLGPVLAEDAGPTGDAVVATWSELRCGVTSPEGATRLPDGEILEDEPCHEERRRTFSELVRHFQPDVVVYYLANAGGLGEYRYGDDWVEECDPVYNQYFVDAITQDLTALRGGEQGDTPLLIATSPYVGSLDAETSNRRVDCRNASNREVAGSLPDTEIVDMNAYVSQEIARDDTEMIDLFRDVVHFSDEGSRRVSDWLLAELDARVP